MVKGPLAAAAAIMIATLLAQQQTEMPDIRSILVDLRTPPMETGTPAAGKRVKQTTSGYEDGAYYHALYLPLEWKPGGTYPVIVEYAGNGPFSNKYGDISTGMVEGSNLGYGISGGRRYIWISMPYLNTAEKKNQIQWWGDVAATAEYCRRTVRRVCEQYGGDPSAVILAGFSRGAIACNYIGLHDDQIADVWLAFVPYSHYDGVRSWQYPESDRVSALARLRRLNGREVFVSHEQSVAETRAYIESTGFAASFRFVTIPFRNHNDTWTLRDIAERRQLRDWLDRVVERKPGTHAITGKVTGAAGRPLAGVRVESGLTHWTTTGPDGRYTLAGLIDSSRTVVASWPGGKSQSRAVVINGTDVDVDFREP